jgi:NAD(P)-dependent dehydrogenase (short-subunit alcohol dehydrogenase family)
MSNDNPMRSLRGQVYLVSGASRGVGLGICHALARRDTKMGMLARTRAELERAAGSFGPLAHPVVCDVTEPSQATRAVDEVAEHFGRLDGVINNAGGPRLAPVVSSTSEDIRAMLDLNIMGAVHCTAAALPHLRKCGGGHVINLSSSLVRHPEEFPHMGAYAGIKAGLDRLTHSMREELRPEGIAVTLFSPGGTITPAPAHWDQERLAAAMKEYERSDRPTGGAMSADLVGEAIVRCLEVPPARSTSLSSFGRCRSARVRRRGVAS